MTMIYLDPNNTELQGATTLVSLEGGFNFLEHRPRTDDEPTLTLTKYVPEALIQRYIGEAMKMMKLTESDGRWLAEVPDLPGVWAEGDNPKNVIDELSEVVMEWLLLKIEENDRDIPRLAGIDLNVA